MSTEPPFRSIAIVGLGLIGGSLALATRERWPSVRVVGVDTDDVLAHVRGSSAIDRTANRLEDVEPVDAIVLAAPVQQNRGLLPRLRGRGEVVVTDVGSTKRAMMADAVALEPSVAFVGGHPLAGAERGGFAYARPDLFEGRPWIFTPATAGRDVLDRLTRFVTGLGARPVTMTADQHDHLMAFLSHLPQLTASALMDVVGETVGADALRLAGRGLIDTTRLASSPVNVWRDVCETNAIPIAAALDALIARLQVVRAELNDGDTLDALFEGAARWRVELTRDRT